MKAIFIAFDQAHYEKVLEALEKHVCRGFTAWETVLGRGSKTGDPHYGSHAWPSMASAMMTMVEDEDADAVLRSLKELDETRPMLGLRAWSWSIEKTV